MALGHSDGILDVCDLILGRPLASARGARIIDMNDHGIEVIGKRLLGKGVFNDVYAYSLKARQGSTVREIALKKVQSQIYKGKTTTQQIGVGIDHSELRLASRNIATSILDECIGTASAPRSSIVSIEGQVFLAMTIAPGISAKQYYRRDPSIVLNPVFQRRCNDVEILAYLSGNPDAHSGNIMVASGHGRDVDGIRVTMIDSDFTFGPKVDNPDCMKYIAGNNKFQYRHTGLPAFIDVNTASRLRSMQRTSITDALGEFLVPSEVAAFETRLERTLDHIEYLRHNNRIVFDWKDFVNAQGDALDGGDFFRGTLEFAGVMQGRLREEEYFCPRSIIVRDCLEDRLGGAAELDALIGPGRRALLHAWPRSAKKYLPPSGVDHR